MYFPDDFGVSQTERSRCGFEGARGDVKKKEGRKGSSSSASKTAPIISA
jgi:hypothetical protein